MFIIIKDVLDEELQAEEEQQQPLAAVTTVREEKATLTVRGVQPPCKQAKRARPEGGCEVLVFTFSRVEYWVNVSRLSPPAIDRPTEEP